MYSHEERLHAVKHCRRRKYNSYQGEISPAVENLLQRDFHSEKPNEKRLTDITEFSILDGNEARERILPMLMNRELEV